MDLRYRRDCCTEGSKSLSHLGDQGAGFANVKRLWKPQPSFPNRPYRQSHDGILVESHTGSAYVHMPTAAATVTFLWSALPFSSFPSTRSLPPALVDQIWQRRIPARSNTSPRAGLGWAALRVGTHSRSRGGGKSRRRRGTVRESAMVVKKQLLSWSSSSPHLGKVNVAKGLFCSRFRNELANVLPFQRGFLLPNAHTTQHTHAHESLASYFSNATQTVLCQKGNNALQQATYLPVPLFSWLAGAKNCATFFP